MDNLPFAVVIFEADNSVEIVPKTWILKENNCKFPADETKKSLRKLVKTQSPPKSDWETYVTKHYGFYGKYFRNFHVIIC